MMENVKQKDWILSAPALEGGLVTPAKVGLTIEIINNTREGIVMFIQAKKGNASNGRQKIQMLK